MADKILGSHIVDQSAEVELAKLYKQLDMLLDKFVETANGAKILNAVLRNAASTEEVVKGVNAYGKSLTELEKQQKQIIDTNQKVVNSETKLHETLILKRMQLVENNKEIRENIKANRMQEGSIDQLNAKLVQMKRAYTELAAAERDAAKGVQMLAHIQSVRTEVGKLEATMGMYHKNVGNYTNATFQMTQVLREVPNFAQSAEIGIRSLSNNLPMLADAFSQVKKETGSTMGALKVFGSSLLSFSGIFPIVLTLLIAYSKEIMAYVSGTKEADKATKELAKSIGAEVAETKLLSNVIKSANTSYEEKLIASKKLIELYPQTLKNYKAEEIAAGKAADAIDRITNSLIANAKIKAIQADIEKIAADQYEASKNIQTQSSAELQLRYERERIQERIKLLRPGSNSYDIEIDKLNSINNAISQSQTLIKEYKNTLELSEKAMAGLAEKAAKLMPSVLDETKPPKAPKEKKANEPFTFLPPDLTPTPDEIKNIDNYYKRLSEEQVKIIKEYFNDPAVQEQLAKDLQLPDVPFEELKLNPKKITINKEELLRAISQVSNAFFESGSIINDAIDKQNEERFSTQEAQMNAYYDAEEERIKQSGKSQAEQQELLMKLAAQKEAQQKKIDNERAQAQRKSAQRQKAIDMAQIIANTALAVTAALTDKTLGPIGRAAAAVAAGITGAAQLAAVALTPLPQYKEGIGIGNGEHKGGLAVVGDGGEHELIVEPSGKSYISPDKSTIMNLPKKTKVIPQHKLLKMVQDATHVSLANTNQPITENTYMAEMINQYEKLASKVDDLTNVMANKKMQTNIYSDYDHNLHVQKNRF